MIGDDTVEGFEGHDAGAGHRRLQDGRVVVLHVPIADGAMKPPEPETGFAEIQAELQPFHVVGFRARQKFAQKTEIAVIGGVKKVNLGNDFRVGLTPDRSLIETGNNRDVGKYQQIAADSPRIGRRKMIRMPQTGRDARKNDAAQ